MPLPGSTTARGYGHAHQLAARRLKAAMRDGDPCCRCDGPMWRWQLQVGRHDLRGIDADHHAQPRALGGVLPDALSHRRCNRAHGARLGNQRRRERSGSPEVRESGSPAVRRSGAQEHRRLPQW